MNENAKPKVNGVYFWLSEDSRHQSAEQACCRSCRERSDRMGFQGLIAVMALAGAASTALAREPIGEVETVRVSPVLTQTIILPASAEEVWDAFTTQDGYQGWAAPFARIDLSVGGTIEASYADSPQAGAPENIVIEIQAYVPHELLVLKTVQAPPDFASQETLDRLVSVFEFEALDDHSTRLTIHGVGYEESDERLRQFFIQGNAWSMQQLSVYLGTQDNEPAQ